MSGDLKHMFYIEKNLDSLYRFIGKNCDTLYLNGCSGMTPDYQKYKPSANEDNEEWYERMTEGFKSRNEAEIYKKENNIDGKVYFYGGCGCCGCWYEDDDGTIRDVTWPAFYPEDATSEEINELNLQNKKYDEYVKHNKQMLKNNIYLKYGENLKICRK